MSQFTFVQFYVNANLDFETTALFYWSVLFATMGHFEPRQNCTL